MKKFCFVLLFVGLFFVTNVFAVVSSPYPVNTKQSDNTTLTIKLFGDERLSWASTLDGYTLLRNEKQDFVYAVLDKNDNILPSNIIAHNERERTQEELTFLSSIQKNLFFSKEQLSLVRQYNAARYDFEKKISKKNTSSSHTTDYKMLVILMSFADRPFTTTQQEVNALYNQVGYSANGNGGSVHDYFIASTANQLNVSATVLGPYTAANNSDYYGKDTVLEFNGTLFPVKDINVRELIQEAIYAADYDNVDFTPFTNGSSNDEVECVYVIYAGYAQSSGNSANTIWPHRSVLRDRLYVGGVAFYNYGCSSEFEGNEDYSAGPLMIGTICHEFSHVLGLPDFYDTDYQNGGHSGESFHPQKWDIMASGNYNGGSGYPPLWSATEREIGDYANVDIQTIDQEGSYTLSALDASNKVYKIATDNTDEYFILENRQQRGFDTYLPGHGMIIYHVDKSVWNLSANCVNCTPGHEGYKIVTSPEVIGANNPFPGNNNKTSFTDNTTPNSLSYSGVSTNKPIYDIAENNTTKNITFTFINSSDFPLISNTVIDFKGDTLNLSAQISSLTNAVIQKGVCYSPDNDTPTINDENIISSNTGNTIQANILGLNPNTYYYVRAFAKTSARVSYGETIKIKTPCSVVNVFPYSITFEDEDSQTSCLEASDIYATNTWQIVSQAEDMNNNTITAYQGDKFAYFYSNNSLSAQELKLISMPLNINYLSLPAISFAYQNKRVGNRKDILTVYYKTSLSSSWTLLKTYDQGTTTWTLDTIDLPIKSSTLYIAFEGQVRSAGGVYVDDVRIFDKNILSYPIISTLPMEEVADVSALAKANLSSVGSLDFVKKGFVLSSNNSTPTLENASEIFASTDATLGVFQMNLENLIPNTTYYIRAFAQNQALISYGETQTFTTICKAIEDFPYQPVLNSEDTLCFDNEEGIWYVDTNSQNGVYTYTTGSVYTDTPARLITPMMNLSYKENIKLSFDYATISTSNTNSLIILFKNSVDANWQVIDTLDISNLTYQNKKYAISSSFSPSKHSFIAFAPVLAQANINIKNIIVDATSQIPIVTTDSATLLDYNKIKVYATLHNSGLSAITSKGICYSTTNNPTIENTTVLSNSADNSFEIEIDNLPILTQYYVRAFATNSYGTAYGEIIPISTKYYSVYNNIISDNQDLCNVYPDIISGQTPTGGNNTFTYLWIHSTDLITWEECNEGVFNDRVNYQPHPTQMIGTHYYARVVFSGQTVDTSNYVTINIYSESNGGNVFANSSSVTLSDTIVLNIRAYNGNVLSWHVKKPAVFYDEWQEIENTQGITTLKYIPETEGELTFKALVQNGVCPSKESGERKVQVNNVSLVDIENNAKNILLTPNPSDGITDLIADNIKSQNVTLTINQTNGAKIYTENIILSQGVNSLNLSFLSNGSYIIVIKGADFDWQGKLIITK